jgi:DNA helicase IV
MPASCAQSTQVQRLQEELDALRKQEEHLHLSCDLLNEEIIQLEKLVLKCDQSTSKAADEEREGFCHLLTWNAILEVSFLLL